MARLSVIVITFNEEKNIERCLRSIQWADEIIVVDSFSTDSTIEIVKKFTNKILQHEYDGDIRQRERGFEISSSEWLMYIDADEEVTIELQSQILEVIKTHGAREGYSFVRKSQIFGKWTEHGGWFPDYVFRLFRKDCYDAELAEVHGGFAVDGEKGILNGLLLHYTYDSVDQYLSKMNDYTSLALFNKLKENPSVNVGPLKIIFSPVSHFLRKFISQKGYKDGLYGFILAMLGGIYTFALYAKLWEYRFRKKEGKGLLPPITNLELQRVKRI